MPVLRYADSPLCGVIPMLVVFVMGIASYLFSYMLSSL